MRPSDRREHPPGQGRWYKDSAGQDRPRGRRDQRFNVPTGLRKSAHSHLTVTTARVQSTTPTHLAPHSAWPAESNCPGCSPETCCESSAEDLARAGSIHHHCSSCSTCAVNVEVTRQQCSDAGRGAGASVTLAEAAGSMPALVPMPFGARLSPWSEWVQGPDSSCSGQRIRCSLQPWTVSTRCGRVRAICSLPSNPRTQ